VLSGDQLMLEQACGLIYNLSCFCRDEVLNSQAVDLVLGAYDRFPSR
jgi:hypothetical protein